jgi:hypothetical protein
MDWSYRMVHEMFVHLNVTEKLNLLQNVTNPICTHIQKYRKLRGLSKSCSRAALLWVQIALKNHVFMWTVPHGLMFELWGGQAYPQAL